MFFDPTAYGPVVAAVLKDARRNKLGPGEPNAAVRSKLAALTPEAIVQPHPLGDPQMAECCLAGLWLRHDFLDESHHICQEIENPTGSYWHGIMHRREPDFSNSNYWFRRVGRHPIFEPLAAAARTVEPEVNLPEEAAALVREAHWDPAAFVQLCKSAIHSRSPLEDWCERVQQREWELLFDYCYSRAIGR